MKALSYYYPLVISGVSLQHVVQTRDPLVMKTDHRQEPVDLDLELVSRYRQVPVPVDWCEVTPELMFLGQAVDSGHPLVQM